MTIWFWGGGGCWQILSRDGLFIFRMNPAGKNIVRYTNLRISIFIRNKILKAKKTQKPHTRVGEEGGGAEC